MLILFLGCASKKDLNNNELKTAAQNATVDVPSPLPDKPSLENIEVFNEKGLCKIKITTNIQPTYTIFKLSQPERLIIDLPDVLSKKNIESIDVQNDYITNIKSTWLSDKKNNFLRVEVGLKDDFLYKALNENNCISIDIYKKDTSDARPDDKPGENISLNKNEKICPKKAVGDVISIKDIKTSETTSDHKIIIVADSEIEKYSSYSFQNPNRLVIDIPRANSLLNKTSFKLDSPLIEKIRVGEKKDIVRIAIDLKGNVFPVYQISQEKNYLNISLGTEKTISPAAKQNEEITDYEILPENLDRKKYSGDKISLDFKDADIKNVLRLISDISGLNLIVSDKVVGKVTLKLENIPWDEAFEIILDSNNLGRIDSNNITRIETMDEIKKINQEKLLAIKSQENIEELEVKTFDVSYAKASDLKKFIMDLKVLSNRGSVTPFSLTNKITIQDLPANILKVEKLISEQDVATRQVLIEAKVVQSNPSWVKELGVRWGGTYNTTHNGGLANGGSDITASGAASGTNVVNLLGPANGAISFGYIKDNLSLDMQLTAMENEDKIKIISNPRILGLDNKEARIKQGVALPYLKLNDQGVTSTEFKDAVLELAVTPKITPANTIALHIFVTKNQKSAQTGAGNEPGIDIREVETDLLIESGETAVIGGIYETTKSHNIKKVPFFGDMPYLGRFFKNEKQEDQITELLVFITVTVVERENIAAANALNDNSGLKY
jgi:type IV pilus assembly protein PilQ